MMPIEPRDIRSPMAFVQVLQEIKQAVARGILRPIPSPQPIQFPEVTLDSIPLEGPWPDYIDMCFEDIDTGDTYRLMVEIYHGTGGRWEKIS
jgi:hypothetical protein